MPYAIEELVAFTGRSGGLMGRVSQAVEWVYSTPEGYAVLEQAFKLHGKRLEIHTDTTMNYNHYGDSQENHIVLINPAIWENTRLYSQNGEIITPSLERFFTHEFVHATQPDVVKSAKAYNARKEKIQQELFQNEFHSLVPIAQYEDTLKRNAHDDDALKKVFGEIYDIHIAPHMAQLSATTLDRMVQDEVIKDFVAQYEIPCIQFENTMMGKYFGEPGRTLDYIHSNDYSQALNRDSFVDSALAGIRAEVPPRSTPYFSEESPETTIVEPALEQTRSTHPPITGAMPGASSANATSMIIPASPSLQAPEKGKDVKR